MKHMKRVLCVFMISILAFSCALSASAADKTIEAISYADALNYLELFKGTNNGYELDSRLNREQAITMVVRMLGAEEEALEKNYPHPFTDVPTWAHPYVGYAYTNQITKGLSETVFGAGQPVTETQFMTFLLRLLKYEDGVDFTWDAAEALAHQNGLKQEYATSETGFIRGGVVILCWQFLTQKAKGSEITVAEELIAKNVFSSNAFEEAKKIAESIELEDVNDNQGNSGEEIPPVMPPVDDDNDGVEDSTTEDIPLLPPADDGNADEKDNPTGNVPVVPPTDDSTGSGDNNTTADVPL